MSGFASAFPCLNPSRTLRTAYDLPVQAQTRSTSTKTLRLDEHKVSNRKKKKEGGCNFPPPPSHSHPPTHTQHRHKVNTPDIVRQEPLRFTQHATVQPQRARTHGFKLSPFSSLVWLLLWFKVVCTWLKCSKHAVRHTEVYFPKRETDAFSCIHTPFCLSPLLAFVFLHQHLSQTKKDKCGQGG